jgi:hypothetical protein
VCGGSIIAPKAKAKAKRQSSRNVSFQSAEVREIGKNLATLGLVRMEKGSKLNVRRREKLRRALREAGAPLRWSVVAATSDDPVAVAAKDLKKLVRSGARSLDRSLTKELADKKSEVTRLTKVVASLQKIAADPKVEYPMEVSYSRTAKGTVGGYVVKTETLTLANSDAALSAARKIEKSLPRWTKLRDEFVEDLKRRRESVEDLTGNLSGLVESWRGMLKEVLVTMRH